MTAWDHAFGLLSTARTARAAQIVAASAKAAKDNGELGEWLRLADCLYAVHKNRTL